MTHSSTHTAASLPRRQFAPNIVSINLANSLVGRSVDVSAGNHKITHGVVAGVIEEAGKPRIIVGRATYDLSQVLTITPA